jgi:endonuclease YncB( thermonuclease family)
LNKSPSNFSRESKHLPSTLPAARGAFAPVLVGPAAVASIIAFRTGSDGRRAKAFRAPILPILLLAVGLAGAIFLGVWPGPGEAVEGVRFGICGRPPHSSCVIDGDTFYLNGQSIRLADIDAPETHPARCTYEATLGTRATRRLHDLLNAGPLVLKTGFRDVDRYGRKLRVVHRDGRSVGRILVSEGLARKWTGHRSSWCG